MEDKKEYLQLLKRLKSCDITKVVDIRKKIVPAFSVSKMEEGGCPKAAPLFSGPAKAETFLIQGPPKQRPF